MRGGVLLETLTWEEWVKQYQPSDIQYETYGDDWEHIKSLDEHHVWTLIDGDGKSVLISGRAFINRLSYYVTEIPWTGDVEVPDED